MAVFGETPTVLNPLATKYAALLDALLSLFRMLCRGGASIFHPF